VVVEVVEPTKERQLQEARVQEVNQDQAVVEQVE
tara:strand:+ start:353 stop:454 length:102 start_codon:yes stop_codon:yes gene_type:complete